MANYYCKIRTNYFSVTDEAKFKEVISKCEAEDEIVVNSDGGKHMFYCDGSISGLPDNENDEYTEYNYDAFCEALQGVLVDDDAIIITEVGYEKMRYLVGVSLVITTKEIRQVSLNDEAVRVAGMMLGNSEYGTQMDY